MNFMKGIDSGKEVMVKIARRLGFSQKEATEAFSFAKGKLDEMMTCFKIPS